MHGIRRIDNGCTEEAPPYTVETRDASRPMLTPPPPHPVRQLDAPPFWYRAPCQPTPPSAFETGALPVMFGRPNITSSNTEKGQIGGWSNSNDSQTRGAFSSVGLGYGPRSQSSYRDGFHIMISLNAQGSSSVYGRSSSVQPASVRFLPCIRI